MKKLVAFLIAILMVPTMSLTPVSFAEEEAITTDSIEESIPDENIPEEDVSEGETLAGESEEVSIASFAEEKTAGEGGYVENEVIVVFHDDITVEEAKQITEGEVEIISPEKTTEDSAVIESGEQTLVAVDENKPMEEALSDLSEKEEVAYVQPNFLYELDDPSDETTETGETGNPEDPSEPEDPSNPEDPSQPSDPTEPEPEVTDVVDPLLADQWYFKYIDVQNAWNLVDALRDYDGTLDKDQRIKVATIDTGVSLTHEDLQKNIDKDNCVQTIVSNPYDEAGNPVEDGGEPVVIHYNDPDVDKAPVYTHGTPVTSIIAATSNNGKGIAGVAAGNHNDIVSVMGINPFYDTGYFKQCSATSADIMAALDYAKAHGAQVINMSMGHNDDVYNGYYLDVNGKRHNDVALERKCNELADSGITIICSAGNDQTGKGDKKDWFPSDFASTISVIALNQYTDAYANVKKSNSNYGKKKDLSAPGQNLRSCTLSGSYGWSNNTSNATPQVTGVVSLMLAVDPSLTPDEIRDILCKKATGLYTDGWDEYTAVGMVNAYGSVAETARRAAEAGKLDISEEELADILAETKPTALEGKHLGTPKITKVSRGKKYLTLTWKYSAPKYLYKIKIYRAKGNGAFKCVKTFTKKTTKWKNTGLKRKTTYRYKIVVYGTTSTGKKIWSQYSPIVKKKTK